MKNLFPGYYYPSKEEFEKLWDECIFVFDTNILLNVYRYSESARTRLFEILDLIKDRIWIPYQVAYEYQEERLNVISQQLKPYDEIQKVLKENLDKLNEVINKYRKRHSFTSLVDEDKIIKTFKRANNKVSKKLTETKDQFPDLHNRDIYRDKIDTLFSGKIGQPYDEQQFKEACKKIKIRFEQEKPPGYEDKNKSSSDKQCGDAILWLQIIDYAKTKNKPVIFITDDIKEDWWKKHDGKIISPRPELIQEIKSQAGVNFWMYTGDRFLMYAEEYLELLEEPEVIEEAKDVRKVNDITAIKLAKLIQSTSMSPTLSKQLDAFDQSMQESLNPARKAIENFHAYRESLSNAIKAYYDLSRNLKIYNNPNFEISGDNLESNSLDDQDDLEED